MARANLLIRKIIDLGCHFALDDFGTGFTSLVQLVEYEIDKIKLDRSFVEKVLARDRVEVIASLVKFCESQRFAVIAEGVETPQQARVLRAAGCEFLQGFHFIEPVGLDRLISPECIARLRAFRQEVAPEPRGLAGRPAAARALHPA